MGWNELRVLGCSESGSLGETAKYTDATSDCSHFRGDLDTRRSVDSSNQGIVIVGHVSCYK